MLVWLSVWSEVFAYSLADATAIPKPHNLASFKSLLVVLEKRPLNECSSISSFKGEWLELSTTKLCDAIWHASSRSSVATLETAIYLLLYFSLLTG